MENVKKYFLTLIPALGVALFLVLVPTGAQAQTVNFFVDDNFDRFSRDIVPATQMVEGENARYFVDNDYWNSLSAGSQSTELQNIQNLSNTFDSQIYSNVTNVFGSEWKPGIDGDNKVTILIMQMKNGLGGYFTSNDQAPRTQIFTSNEREMFYLATAFLGDSTQIEAFAAHELQHLINFNQKNREHNVQEETWLNELMSEMAPEVSGLNTPYNGSYLQNRTEAFLNSPNDPITVWTNQEADYGSVNILGNYFLDHFGEQFFTELAQNPNKGIASINTALPSVGSSQSFKDVFSNWVVTNVLNNCNVLPVQTFCYLNPNLNANNLLIEFSPGVEGGDVVTDVRSTRPWQGNWLSYTREDSQEAEEKPVFIFTIDKPTGRDFAVPYVVYPENGLPQVYFMTFADNTAKFYIDDFGVDAKRIDVMPIYRQFSDSTSPVTYTIRAEVSDTAPQDATQSLSAEEMSSQIKEGSLVREEGDTRVYIIKNGYKRWVQSAEIIDMYGHLTWDSVVVVPGGTLDSYETVALVRFMGDPRVFFVNSDNTKTWIQTEEEFLAEGYRFDMVYEINQKEFNFYPEV